MGRVEAAWAVSAGSDFGDLTTEYGLSRRVKITYQPKVLVDRSTSSSLLV